MNGVNAFMQRPKGTYILSALSWRIDPENRDRQTQTRPSSDSPSTHKSTLNYLGSKSVRKSCHLSHQVCGSVLEQLEMTKNYPGYESYLTKRLSLLTDHRISGRQMELADVNTHLAPGQVCHESPSPVTSGLIRVTKNSSADETLPQPWPYFVTKMKTLESKLRSAVSTS